MDIQNPSEPKGIGLDDNLHTRVVRNEGDLRWRRNWEGGDTLRIKRYDTYVGDYPLGSVL